MRPFLWLFEFMTSCFVFC